ncbi:hypothetical protein [Pseudoclavibacter sp. VKM Ac-2867]|uniref:hypothetical protein n=1 Tax=Pseudoclavibacter sp. VKM Ac-2867 TaxID=2783829 RepID=UPI00188ABB0A|nr:hypothetical protein [Pseudoclavibacter sp. VKM Ac-2867]MBF4459557.1 hypothetical protein [Pseudoclavibacter sp. VKM Ac-2867]
MHDISNDLGGPAGCYRLVTRKASEPVGDVIFMKLILQSVADRSDISINDAFARQMTEAPTPPAIAVESHRARRGFLRR